MPRKYDANGVPWRVMPATQSIRRDQFAAEQISAHVSTLGDHSRCDPGVTDSLCAECFEIWGDVAPKMEAFRV